jgi:GTP-binding protein
LPPLTVFESELDIELEVEENEQETTVRRENDHFYVEGKWLYDLLGRTNLNNYESLSYFQRSLIKGGVIKLLEEKGCADGHTVHIYDFEFEFIK